MTRTDRLAEATSGLIMLAMGGLAGAASFTHVHDLAAHHGQRGWLAWAVAVSIELMALVAALEIRRSRRAGQPVGVPFAVLVGGFALSLAANVAEAEQSVWGWITAATPAGAFLVVAKLALRRLDTPDPADSREPSPAEATPADPEPTSAREPEPAPVPEAPPAVSPTPAPVVRPGLGGLAPALVEHARRIAADHQAATGRPITVEVLRSRLGVPAPLAASLHAALTV